jgi:hypothetical protein
MRTNQQATSSTMCVTHIKKKDILVRIVQIVTPLSLTWSTIFIYSLGGPMMARANRMIKSSTNCSKAIWVPKSLLTNLHGPNVAWVPKYA